MFFSVVFWFIGVIEHRGRCSPKGLVSITTLVKIHIKIYIIPWSMGHIFQAKWWEKHPSGCSFSLSWLRKSTKAKTFGKEKWHLFMKIMENRRKGR